MTLSYRKTVNRVDKSISPTRQKMNLKKELLQALEGSKWHPENPKRNSLKKVLNRVQRLSIEEYFQVNKTIKAIKHKI